MGVSEEGKGEREEINLNNLDAIWSVRFMNFLQRVKERSKDAWFFKVASSKEVILNNVFNHLKISIKHLLCIIHCFSYQRFTDENAKALKWETGTFMEIICY